MARISSLVTGNKMPTGKLPKQQIQARHDVCTKVVREGGYIADCADILGTVQHDALYNWLKRNEPILFLALKRTNLKRKDPTKSAVGKRRAQARVDICERIAQRGGTIEDAACELGTISPNGLYCWLKTYAPDTFRRICRKRVERGGNYTISPQQSIRRIKLIKELGYTGAARALGMNSRIGTQRLYSWYRYRRETHALNGSDPQGRPVGGD